MLNYQLLRQQHHQHNNNINNNNINQPFNSLISDNFNFNNNDLQHNHNNNNNNNSSMPSISTFNNSSSQHHPTTVKPNNEASNEQHLVMSNNNYYLNAILQHQQQHQQQQNNGHDSSTDNVYSNKQAPSSNLSNQVNNNTYSYQITNNNSLVANHQKSNPIYVQADQFQPAFCIKDRYFVPLYCGICRAYGCQCFYGAGGGGPTTSTGPTTNCFNGTQTLSELENVTSNQINNAVG